MPASSRQGSLLSPPRGRSFSPSTVIVRSPVSSTNVKARRVGSASGIARTSTPRRPSSARERRPSSSAPSPVNKRHEPASRHSWTAATAPPPAGSSHVSNAWTISPGRGTASTRANSTHSTCPTTATRIGRSSHVPCLARFKMSPMTLPPFERFYAEHREEIFAFLVRRLGHERAEDAFQETFLSALRAYPRLRHSEHLRAWAYTIASRIAIDEHRRPRADAELPELATLDGRPAFAELEHLADELPPTERAAVVLRYGYDLDYAEIGAALGSHATAARQPAPAGIRTLRRKEAP